MTTEEILASDKITQRVHGNTTFLYFGSKKIGIYFKDTHSLYLDSGVYINLILGSEK